MCHDPPRPDSPGRALRGAAIAKEFVYHITAVAVLALGTAASVAIFAFVDAALLKPLPYRNPSRLVGVFGSIPLFERSNLSYPDYLDFKKLNTAFALLRRIRPMDIYSLALVGRRSRAARG